MKRETLEKKKFNLDKFEVARLSNMKNINGGAGGGGFPTGTETLTLSSIPCRSLATSISDTNPNTTNG